MTLSRLSTLSLFLFVLATPWTLPAAEPDYECPAHPTLDQLTPNLYLNVLEVSVVRVTGLDDSPYLKPVLIIDTYGNQSYALDMPSVQAAEDIAYEIFKLRQAKVSRQLACQRGSTSQDMTLEGSP